MRLIGLMLVLLASLWKSQRVMHMLRYSVFLKGRVLALSPT